MTALKALMDGVGRRRVRVRPQTGIVKQVRLSGEPGYIDLSPPVTVALDNGTDVQVHPEDVEFDDVSPDRGRFG